MLWNKRLWKLHSLSPRSRTESSASGNTELPYRRDPVSSTGAKQCLSPVKPCQSLFHRAVCEHGGLCLLTKCTQVCCTKSAHGSLGEDSQTRIKQRKCLCPLTGLLSLPDSLSGTFQVSASDPQISLQRNGLYPKEDGIKKARTEQSLRIKGKERCVLATGNKFCQCHLYT